MGRRRSLYLKPCTTLNAVQQQGHANTFDFDPLFPVKYKDHVSITFSFLGEGGVFFPAMRKGSMT